MENCEVVGVVNFGKGPVEVRCTETGEHNDHKCVVRLSALSMADTRRMFHNDQATSERKNVFEKD